MHLNIDHSFSYPVFGCDRIYLQALVLKSQSTTPSLTL
jgi:hypothetical protein